MLETKNTNLPSAKHKVNISQGREGRKRNGEEGVAQAKAQRLYLTLFLRILSIQNDMHLLLLTSEISILHTSIR